MAKTTRQSAIFGVEDWRRIFQTYREADFQSYDFETLRKSFVDYLRVHHPESFNDYTESSEFIALLDVMAFMGQALAYRSDLNARENFIETAERRESVVKLAELVSYTPKRNERAAGFLKISSVSTTEHLVDYNGRNLAGVTINWNDVTNPDWYEQFVIIMNAIMVDSQRVGRPGNSATVLGIKTDEYAVNTLPGFLPVLTFSSTVDGKAMNFEAVSATTRGSLQVYEPPPRPSNKFNILYRNDQLGYASPSTGFFFYFKQGRLRSQDLEITDRIANRVIPINLDNINNDDVWLYEITPDGAVDVEWTRKDGLFSQSVTQSDAVDRKFYDITTAANDRISLVFGDGVFSEIPTGSMRVYGRASNGLEYIINPDEIQSLPLSISYVSRKGRVETVSFVLSLTLPVTNARARETLDEIRTRAPSRFYTQNRMVNGEDYSNFPYTLYGSIIKSKAVNRSSIGTSRYLDLLDVTGKYSSTNTFASDGILYRANELPLFSFSWDDRSDIATLLGSQIKPIISSRGTAHFYYDPQNFPRQQMPAGIMWHQSTAIVNETTGFFKNVAGHPVPIGQFATDAKKYITPASMVRFEPPPGFFFDVNNRLQVGAATGQDTKTHIWATVLSVLVDGTNSGQGADSTGAGPVTLSDFVPTGAIAREVVPILSTSLTKDLENALIEETLMHRNFGLGYDPARREWYLITNVNLAAGAPFSLDSARDDSSTNADASWIIEFVSDGSTYTIMYRTLRYYFASASETRFFYDNIRTKIYDPKTGSVVNDFIKVLKTNLGVAQTARLSADVVMDIVGQNVEPDGYVDDFKVLVSFMDSDYDGIADDPDFFSEIVSPTAEVFFERIIDRDNLERYVPLPTAAMNTQYLTKTAIEAVKFQYPDGQLFYVRGEKKYFELTLDVYGNRILVERAEFIVRNGRGDLQFQYRHNSPTSRRIDPGTSNIIDLYVVTNAYYQAFQNYIKDSTNTVPEPLVPTIEQLMSDYDELHNYKMMSDNIVVNSVQFKPLFGAKAPLALQGTIKVIRFANSTVSDSEIKSRVIEAINEYFSIEKWDFGMTFYFSELAAYLHAQVGDIVSSVVLVPKDPLMVFGNLYEIRSEPSEIFVSAATVNDVEVVESITPSSIRSIPGISVI